MPRPSLARLRIGAWSATLAALFLALSVEIRLREGGALAWSDIGVPILAVLAAVQWRRLWRARRGSDPGG